ncbi:MAG: hypothetical protein WBG70_08415 [Spirulinaceae cyanobacterium]
MRWDDLVDDVGGGVLRGKFRVIFWKYRVRFLEMWSNFLESLGR